MGKFVQWMMQLSMNGTLALALSEKATGDTKDVLLSLSEKSMVVPIDEAAHIMLLINPREDSTFYLRANLVPVHVSDDE